MANLMHFGGFLRKLVGTATAADVYPGKTFYNTDAKTIVTGTMPTGTVTGSVGVDGTFTNTPNKYVTSVSVTGPTLSGNAGTGDVLSGKTFYSNSGTQQRGTLALSGNAGAGDVREGKTFYKDDAKTRLTGTLTPITGVSETYAEKCGSTTAVGVTNGAWYVVAIYVPGQYDFGNIYGMDTTLTRRIGCNRIKTSSESEAGTLTGYGQLGVFVGKASAGTIGITGRYGSIIAVKLWG